MSIDVNYWGVLAAGVSSMVVGSIWYAQGVFGKTWGTESASVKLEGRFDPALARSLEVAGHVVEVSGDAYSDGFGHAGALMRALPL